jgi:hypothetical protein
VIWCSGENIDTWIDRVLSNPYIPMNSGMPFLPLSTGGGSCCAIDVKNARKQNAVNAIILPTLFGTFGSVYCQMSARNCRRSMKENIHKTLASIRTVTIPQPTNLACNSSAGVRRNSPNPAVLNPTEITCYQLLLARPGNHSRRRSAGHFGNRGREYRHS